MTRPRSAVIALVVSLASIAPGTHAQTPAPPDGWVVLSVDDYRQLRERAFPQPTPTPPAAIDAVLTRIDYELRPDAEGVSGRALRTIDVLRDGWAGVQIPAGLMVRDATLDGSRVALVDANPPFVLLSRPGRSVLALDIAVPTSHDGGAESIVLPPASSSISRTELTLPRNGVDVVPNGGFVAAHVEAANESRWTLFGRPNTPLSIAWKPRSTTAAPSSR